MASPRASRLVYCAVGAGALSLGAGILGVAYLFLGDGSIFWDFCGWLCFASWTGTIALVLRIPEGIGGRHQEGNRVTQLGFITIAVLAGATVCMFGGVLWLSVATSGSSAESANVLAFLYGCFFGCTGMNGLFAFVVYRRSRDASRSAGSPLPEEREKERSLILPRRVVLVRLGAMLLCAGGVGTTAYFALLSLAGIQLGAFPIPAVGILNGVMGTVSASFGGLFSLFAWSVAVLGGKILRSLRWPRAAIGFGLTGLIIGLVLLAPMATIPWMTSDVDARFAEAFGLDWEARIPSHVRPFFKPRQLVAAEYYLPRPLGDCEIMEDVLFYNGTTGVDDGLQLFFDAYLPRAKSQPLPGKNSTLIRIHGGGWTVGDKGPGNMPLMNRYFASQGYCVFDIQYGLNNYSSFLAFAQGFTPESVKGNYSVNDMVRHIGIFCQFLTLHQTDYHANLSSVFVSGGSAGGHLTCVTALAIASGNYSSVFGSEITIKGFAPFYPANQLAQFVDGGVSAPEFYDPGLLVTATSPPCLVYQGVQDGLVNPRVAQDLKDSYTAHGNPACLVIYLPFAGHGSDLNFYGYFNQFFAYYMERFMYLHR